MRAIFKIQRWVIENKEGVSKWMLLSAIYFMLYALLSEVLAQIAIQEHNVVSPTFLYLAIMCYFIREQFKS